MYSRTSRISMKLLIITKVYHPIDTPALVETRNLSIVGKSNFYWCASMYASFILSLSYALLCRCVVVGETSNVRLFVTYEINIFFNRNTHCCALVNCR